MRPKRGPRATWRNRYPAEKAGIERLEAYTKLREEFLRLNPAATSEQKREAFDAIIRRLGI